MNGGTVDAGYKYMYNPADCNGNPITTQVDHLGDPLCDAYDEDAVDYATLNWHPHLTSDPEFEGRYSCSAIGDMYLMNST